MSSSLHVVRYISSPFDSLRPLLMCIMNKHYVTLIMIIIIIQRNGPAAFCKLLISGLFVPVELQATTLMSLLLGAIGNANNLELYLNVPAV